ncbi:MAG: 3-oxoacyl-[acyl-carrier-protein] synthase 2 [Thermoanaerobacterales bacterium 50_218]|nr:MAG: 3-oxoacyl-[acyl-carrier-protein] synthase 2 [Thermoanaerobacterales bacterium 50_218]HAA90200.1 beta-ketoacyl-[acyl-carrier-protein] synthase II [Peptococcaceae bacterium]
MAKDSREKVVITGLGVVSPIGIGKESFWSSLLEGRSGIRTVTRFDSTGFASRIAGEVADFRPEEFMEKKEVRRMDRFAQFGVAATKMAVADAGLDLRAIDLDRVGVVIGSGIGGIETLEQQVRVLLEKGPSRISPFFVPMMISNMAAGQIAISLGPKGPNFTIVTACASGTNAVGEAFRMIQRGEADVVITGGTEAPITPIAFAGFSAMKAVSTRNEEPAKASRPFDKERDGLVIGEGAGVLILESLHHALKRNARIYCEVAGYGTTADGYHITAPDPEGRGAAQAMELALKDAGISPEDVDYINAHGTSTVLNDKVETIAIKKVFGERAYKIPVSSIKSMIGHCMGAAGALELVATALSVKFDQVPPTINYEVPDPECDLDYVPNEAREWTVEVAISNSFGFGGHNAVVVLRKFQG